MGKRLKKKLSTAMRISHCNVVLDQGDPSKADMSGKAYMQNEM